MVKVIHCSPMSLSLTRPLAEVEGLDGEVDAGCLGQLQTVLQRADTAIILYEETSLHTGLIPLLEERTKQTNSLIWMAVWSPILNLSN